MLRKFQSIALKDDSEIRESLRPELPRTPAQKLDPKDLDKVLADVTWTPPATPAEPERRFGERRVSDRRNMDAWRTDALQTVVTNNDRRKQPPLRRNSGWRFPPARFALLGVALVAGGLAAFLAVQGSEPVTHTVTQSITEVVPEARTQILVARKAIGVGERLSPAAIEWADWPEGAVRPEYVTLAAMPGAVTEMSGSVVRFELFPGEPIRSEKLVQAEHGFLSAVLDSGMRGVSVVVAAASASGGFIVPNDRVDVVLTRNSAAGSQMSDTVLRNVRVLAINNRLGEVGETGAPDEAADPDNPQAQIFANDAIATLELDPGQAEVIISATGSGRLSLVLRPVVDTVEAAAAEQRTTNQSIRMSSPFWAN